MALVLKVNNVTKEFETNSLSVQWKLEARNTADFKIVSRDGTYRPTVGHSVLLTLDGTNIFGGSIDEFSQSKLAGSPALIHNIRCVSYEQILDRRFTGNQLVYGRMPFTADDSTDELTTVDTSVYFLLETDDPVRVATDGTLPGGLSADTTYYWIKVSNTVGKLSATKGGSAINITSTGSGEHRVVYMAGAVVKSVLRQNSIGTGEGIGFGTVSDGAVVELATYSYKRIGEIVQELADLSGYIWYIDADKDLHFVAPTAVAAPFNITNASEVTPAVVERRTREQYINRFLFTYQRPFVQITFNGDGSTRRWSSNFYRIIRNINSAQTRRSGTFADVTFGVKDVDSGKDFYYTPGDRWIYQDSGGTVIASGDALIISVDVDGFSTEIAEDGTEQSARATIEGGTGIYEISDTNEEVPTDTQAAQIAAASLELYMVLNSEVRYRTKLDGLMPGQVQGINFNTEYGVNTDYLIDEVKMFTDQGEIWYDVRAITGSKLKNYLAGFRKFLESGGGGGGGVAAAGSGGGTIGDIQIATEY